MVAAILPLPELSPIAVAVKTLYGIADDINQYIDEHIARLKRSRNPTVARTGRVLEAAKYGFGVTYVSSVTIIAAGQILLGNPLAAASTVAKAATLANPMVMTAAALGAVVYGYVALTDEERDDLHATLSKGLSVGIELIKAIIRFAIDVATKLLSADNLKEMKKFITDKAALFNRTLSQVTRSLADRTADTLITLKDGAKKGKEVLSDSATAFKETAEDAGDRLRDVVDALKKKASRAAATKAVAASSSTMVATVGFAESRNATKAANRTPVKAKRSSPVSPKR